MYYFGLALDKGFKLSRLFVDKYGNKFWVDGCKPCSISVLAFCCLSELFSKNIFINKLARTY